MSIVESLLKIVDPVQAQAREQERRVAREQPRREKERGGEPPHFVCRVCGRTDVQDAYCPDCLADTMTTPGA